MATEFGHPTIWSPLAVILSGQYQYQTSIFHHNVLFPRKTLLPSISWKKLRLGPRLLVLSSTILVCSHLIWPQAIAKAGPLAKVGPQEALLPAAINDSLLILLIDKPLILLHSRFIHLIYKTPLFSPKTFLLQQHLRLASSSTTGDHLIPMCTKLLHLKHLGKRLRIERVSTFILLLLLLSWILITISS